MEMLMIILLLFIFSVAFAVVASIITIIIMAIMKKGLKIPLIALGSSVILLFISLFAAYGLDNHLSNTTNQIVDSAPTESVEVEETGEEEVNTEYEITDEQREEFNEEYDEKMAEVREEREAEEGTDSEDLDNYRTDVDIRDIERNPDDYMNELITFEGKIIQVLEEDGVSAYRIAVNDDYDRVVLVSTQSSSLEERLLEDDYVTVYGEFTELMTYETVVGGSRTVPSFVAAGERIELQ